MNGLCDASLLAECLFAVHFVSPEKSRAEGVMEWLNRSDPRPSQEETKEIMTMTVPYDHPEYWSFVQKLAIRGLFLQCASSLEKGAIPLTDPVSMQAVQSAIYVLQSAPRSPNFESSHRKWRAEVLIACERAAKIQDARLQRGLSTFFDILKGDSDTILALSETWQEATAALMLLHDPSPSRLEEYFLKAADSLPVDETLVWESGCAAVMTGDIAKVSYILI